MHYLCVESKCWREMYVIVMLALASWPKEEVEIEHKLLAVSGCSDFFFYEV